jgi:hypothetical protein
MRPNSWLSARLLFVVLLATLISGCFGHVSYPDQLRLCLAKTDAGGWIGNSVYERDIGAIGKVRFHLHPTDVLDNNNTVLDDGENYWVRITGFTQGRKSFSRFQFEGVKEEIPMIYSVKDAYIELGGGEKVRADSNLYFGAADGSDVPGDELVPQPVDLNSDLVHARTKVNSLSAYRSVFIRFPIRRPAVGDTRRIHLGSVELGGKRVQIPVYQLCFYSGRNEWFMYRGPW